MAGGSGGMPEVCQEVCQKVCQEDDDNMAQFNPVPEQDDNIIKKNIKKTMNGPQGVETLLEILSSNNTKPVIITKKIKRLKLINI